MYAQLIPWKISSQNSRLVKSYHYSESTLESTIPAQRPHSPHARRSHLVARRVLHFYEIWTPSHRSFHLFAIHDPSSCPLRDLLVWAIAMRGMYESLLFLFTCTFQYTNHEDSYYKYI